MELRECNHAKVDDIDMEQFIDVNCYSKILWFVIEVYGLHRLSVNSDRLSDKLTFRLCLFLLGNIFILTALFKLPISSLFRCIHFVVLTVELLWSLLKLV